jgi:hypothetical protein
VPDAVVIAKSRVPSGRPSRVGTGERYEPRELESGPASSRRIVTSLNKAVAKTYAVHRFSVPW